AQVSHTVRLGVLPPRVIPHGGSHADGRSSPDYHRADRLSQVLVVSVGVVDFARGQQALVYHSNAVIGPFDGADHGSSDRQSSVLKFFFEEGPNTADANTPRNPD